MEDALYCDDPKCRIVCREALCLPYLGDADGQSSSGSPVRDGQNERDGRDGGGSLDRRYGPILPLPAGNNESPVYMHPTNLKLPFMIRNGKLYQDGGQFSTKGDVPFQVFEPSIHVSPINTGFDISGYLAWKNDALSKGEAKFCMMPGNFLYIVFTAKPSPACKDVELVVLHNPRQGTWDHGPW